MRIALVHESLVRNGGAERVLDAFHELYPDAPIYTSVYDPQAMGARYSRAEVRTSSLQKLYRDERRYKFALPRLAQAFEDFDFSEFDMVLSSSSAFAKGIVTGPATCHVCYCHTPSRLAWQFDSYVSGTKMSALTTRILRRQAHKIRTWDVTSALRVDQFISKSNNVADRIHKYYGREATTIHAPVDAGRFRISPDVAEDFFLIVGRLTPYKRFDVAVEAFTRMGKALKVVGHGRHEKALRDIAGPTVEFLGAVSDEEVSGLYNRCRALVTTAEEDFGITPLEAMASGRPVIAFGAGGALETVTEGETGVLFDQQHSSSLIRAVRRFENMSFSPQALREYAERFDKNRFKAEIARFVKECAAPSPHHTLRIEAISNT
jgi:glycosyltransferase involved in cell wall biosynthesis